MGHGAMERVVLGVLCLADVKEVPSLVMLVTEGELSRDLSWGERDNAGLLDMSACQRDYLSPPWS